MFRNAVTMHFIFKFYIWEVFSKYLNLYLEMFKDKEKSCYCNLTGINLPVKIK